MERMSSLDCIEGYEFCSNAEKKFRIKTDISVEALTMTTEDRWSLSEIQKAQLGDPDIRPILKMKLNSAILARNLLSESCSQTILGSLELLIS
ncbi:hypothetical protein AVEN_49418-1 [Araneus ventricosus]|uniref:Uncharacterized protein n=1 Tax=Araneus ventricosus TaxID=182803 RepID=A0A4Y2CNN4_ARAVE|nr:hypothetical protein AVEN_49418-1 [Araneus ventricosus]